MKKRDREEVVGQYAFTKKDLLNMSEIGLILDHYDDIFSDFDPRPYSVRALSDDFLFEAKKASRDKPMGSIELKFLVPQDHRNTKLENIIRKRLRQHFMKHVHMLRKEKRDIFHKGLLFVLFGTIVMFGAALLHFYSAEKSLPTSFLLIILEPAGWFLFWEGLHLIVFRSKRLTNDLRFYEKMEQAEVKFISY